MLFLIFLIPIGLISGYLCFTCLRQKFHGAALLMGGVALLCLVLSLVILAAANFVVNAS